MNYGEFKEVFLKEIQKHYDGSVVIEIKPVLRNNNYQYDGLYITKSSSDIITPIINMNQVYERYINEKLELEQCVIQVCQFRDEDHSNESMAEFINKLTKWEDVKEMVYPVLMATKGNEELLSTLVTTPFLDLTVIYKITEKDENGEYSIKVSKSMLCQYGIDAEQLHEQALKNLKRETYQFISMDMFAMVRYFLDNSNNENRTGVSKMYILTSESLMYGATGILDKELIRRLAGEKDYYVILSSMHEALFVQDDGEIDTDRLNEIIADAHKHIVDKEERLSDHFYYYSGETGEISMEN